MEQKIHFSLDALHLSSRHIPIPYPPTPLMIATTPAFFPTSSGNEDYQPPPPKKTLSVSQTTAKFHISNTLRKQRSQTFLRMMSGERHRQLHPHISLIPFQQHCEESFLLQTFYGSSIDPSPNHSSFRRRMRPFNISHLCGPFPPPYPSFHLRLPWPQPLAQAQT